MLAPQFTSSLFSLGTVCSWGLSDFIGGYTARRFQPFFLAALGHLAGTVFVATLAIAGHEPIPAMSHLLWAGAAGATGGFSLALFYRALSQGNMGLAAPVSVGIIDTLYAASSPADVLSQKYFSKINGFSAAG